MSLRLGWAVAIASFGVGAGCQTIPEQECAKADWHALGVLDGRAGYPADRLVEHRKTCARANVEPDELRYLEGRRAGISEYCRPDNAFRDGLAGREYHGLCDAAFARHHRAAYDVATLRKELDANRSAISWREAELRGDRASDDRRNNLRNELRDLDHRRAALRNQLFRAEQELDRMRMSAAGAAAPPAARAPPVPSRSAQPAPPSRDAIESVGPPGVASGGFRVGGIEAPLHFAYVFVAPDPTDSRRTRPLLVLAPEALPADRLAGAARLDEALSLLPYCVLVARDEGTPGRLALTFRHPSLKPSPLHVADAGRSGAARFDAYGPQRIAGSLRSPGDGGRAYAWNGTLRMKVEFDAPLSRRW